MVESEEKEDASLFTPANDNNVSSLDRVGVNGSESMECIQELQAVMEFQEQKPLPVFRPFVHQSEEFEPVNNNAREFRTVVALPMFLQSLYRNDTITAFIEQNHSSDDLNSVLLIRINDTHCPVVVAYNISTDCAFAYSDNSLYTDSLSCHVLSLQQLNARY